MNDRIDLLSFWTNNILNRLSFRWIENAIWLIEKGNGLIDPDSINQKGNPLIEKEIDEPTNSIKSIS